MQIDHRIATWVNTWLPRYGYAIWFYQEFRGPTPEEVEAHGGVPFTIGPEGPIKMRLGRYPPEAHDPAG
jgi:hypothetical protein